MEEGHLEGGIISIQSGRFLRQSLAAPSGAIPHPVFALTVFLKPRNLLACRALAVLRLAPWSRGTSLALAGRLGPFASCTPAPGPKTTYRHAVFSALLHGRSAIGSVRTGEVTVPFARSSRKILDEDPANPELGTSLFIWSEVENARSCCSALHRSLSV